MTSAPPEFAQLELLAEVDALVADLQAWASHVPDWPPARGCRALIGRLNERADALRVRLEAPLVVATLGGTGTGKSTLVNALVGAEVTASGHERPTTRQPVLICKPGVSPASLGIDPTEVRVVERDLPALRDLVIIDCPDPDTTEDPEQSGTNLSRLRTLLPHCDVLLVTATQQKYRSARVLDELASAAPGARLAFVETHADVSDDVRDDWRRALEDEYQVGEMFFVDSRAALADAQHGLEPRGDFARLVELLTRELAGIAGQRIRRANFLDLVDHGLDTCRRRLDAALPAVEQVETALAEQRSRLAAQFTRELRDELSTSRRLWENRLLAEVERRWGFSPFSTVLRIYQSLGSVLGSVALMRARTPAQVALWGVWEGGRTLRRMRDERRANVTPRRVAASWNDEQELRTAAIIMDGYVVEAGLKTTDTQPAQLDQQAQQAAEAFAATAAAQLDETIARQAARHIGPGVRAWYEILLGAMLAMLLYRLGRNFFWDSWLAANPRPLFGLEFFVSAALWLVLWCTLLVWAFTMRLRRGLASEIAQLTTRCATPAATSGVFAGIEQECRAVRRCSDQLDRLKLVVTSLRAEVEQPRARLGHRLV
ncbi:MAG: 50S ribosome-binding GTPase [Pirellulales bacterium]|nr:50S ribosome-binding GTPase [Pirellulales bacterium]